MSIVQDEQVDVRHLDFISANSDRHGNEVSECLKIKDLDGRTPRAGPRMTVTLVSRQRRRVFLIFHGILSGIVVLYDVLTAFGINVIKPDERVRIVGVVR